ncbi:MAG: DUF885 domain-containing protein [Bryobacteraceae bacterium]
MRAVCIAVFIVGLTSCRMPGEKQDFAKLTDDFVYGSLALSPVSATSAGYHDHRGESLDEKLDDYSRSGIMEQRRFYFDFRNRLEAIKPESLSAEDRADYDVMQDQIGLQLFDFTSNVQSFRHNPTIYVELIGNALFNPFVLEYAPKPKRFGHIVKRLQRVPILIEQAKDNLRNAPEVWVHVAEQENNGNIELIDHTLRAAAPAEIKGDYDKAAGAALDALRKFNYFLKTDLSQRTMSWRLGKEKYDQKFRYFLDAGKTPEQVLSEAETELKSVTSQMAKLADPKTIPQALDAIARQHPTPGNYFAEARRTLQQATDFVRSKGLLTLPARANLQVIETPEFMRGIYAVGGFNAAPALEPQLGAFYWITPIPGNWPKERVESKLREYNTYGLQELTIHEAMPGHYVQLEYANDVQPKGRRLLRNIYGNGPYVEGWAVYVQQLLSDEGYLNGSVELRMTFLKQMLRVISNAILDIKLQTQEMTEQQALDLMINQAFQEKEEATAKIQRAQLSSCQLPMYFAGWHGWLQVRDQYKQRRGSGFKLSEFHERALKESAVPLPVLSRLLAK